MCQAIRYNGGGSCWWEAERLASGRAESGDAWHKAGVENGGTAIEDAPGLRANGVYLAYLRDPDGNKLCVVHHPA